MKRACVIGWPVSHSLSPVIHGYWLRENAIEGEYVKEAVEPKDLQSFLEALVLKGFCGGNVTVPHKIEAYRLCDLRDDAAEAIGAVNTLWLEDGKPVASNTDAWGFLANLDDKAPGWDHGDSAVVIGAGGAARAIVWALAERGFGRISIVNRTKERAAELAASFPGAQAFAFDALTETLNSAKLVVNTSTLGMAGAPSLEIDLSPMLPNAVVCDIVYHPLETDLLRQACARGLVAVDGLGMLLHQAVPGFERWFGVRPKVTPGLRDAVLAAVNARENAPK